MFKNSALGLGEAEERKGVAYAMTGGDETRRGEHTGQALCYGIAHLKLR